MLLKSVTFVNPFLVYNLEERNKIKSQLKPRIKRIYSGNLASLIKIGLNQMFIFRSSRV